MTPEERFAAVQERLRRGFPIHRPPHPEQGPGWYFISAATYEHAHHFAAPDALAMLADHLLNALRDGGLTCGGWVVLPNHYHLLVESDSIGSIRRVLKLVHGRTSYEINRRANVTGRKVWYEFMDRKIRSDRHYWASLHYIIQNPVKHEYVAERCQWPWSCIHELLTEHGEDWMHDRERVPARRVR